MSSKQNGKAMSAVEKFRNKKLSYKISVATAMLLGVCLAIMVAISAALAGRSLSSSINGEFTGIAKENGQMVQNIITNASNTATILQEYLEKKYDEYSKKGYDGRKEKSDVYDVSLQSMNKEIENFIVNLATSTAKNNEEIAGVGVFFEQDAFDPAIKDYTVYVSSDDAEAGKVQSYGKYSDYSKNEYYKQAAETQQDYFTDPYEDQGITMVTASFPIVYDGETKGIIVVDINIETFSKLNSSDSKYPSMYVDVYNANSTMVYDSESNDYVGQKLSELISESDYKKIENGMKTGKSFSVSTKKDDGSSIVRYYAPIQAANQTWWAASALKKTDLYSNTVKLVLMMVIISIITLVVIIIVSSHFVRSYIQPISGVMEVADKLSHGDFSVSLEAQHTDEIGELADTFSRMATTLSSIIKDLTRGLNDMATGNFNIAPSVEHVGDFKHIEVALVKVINDLSHTLNEINAASELVAANAAQISQGAQSLTDGAMDQASSVDELQSTIVNVSEQVEKNAENANIANDMAKVVGEDIISSNEQMQQVVEAMEVINESSAQISSIISTIDDIAEQTNLLALNASIEAARAGESGKGFAVVATQVGVLATQSAEAAKNSNDLIVKAMQAVDDGKKVVDETAQKLLASVKKTNDLVKNIGEITEASDKQSQALSQISDAANQIAAVIQENTAMAEESSASSEELSAQADKLKELISVFTLIQE
ncbi:HAMP domain-containing protein [Eubacterium sp. MSJ-13]|uniref:methyl-accepting chemotaxis protein n=1 Tax=Eubacterium sp. MSJ-13 TaxID=2841513 RepID=UPI001C1137F1|nr:methyl-accepting chemotaxis protein [Eubacterium sp. MSJ-13]MBU5478381.1 HAMP domain-containing protein [Eubacterium sp. MSJ-13]